MLTWRPGSNFPPGELTIGVRVAGSGESQMAKHMVRAGRVPSVSSCPDDVDSRLLRWVKENLEFPLV